MFPGYEYFPPQYTIFPKAKPKQLSALPNHCEQGHFKILVNIAQLAKQICPLKLISQNARIYGTR